MVERGKGCIVIDTLDAWQLQEKIKASIIWYAPTVFSPMDVYVFRKKLNSAILRMEDENLSSMEIFITEPEAWIIDSVLNADSYSNAKYLLKQVYRVIWETEYDVKSLNSGSLEDIFVPDMLDGFSEN